MSDLLVSRIQNRRGNLVDLPQPLRPGEFGWCMDTGQLFIGADTTLTASGVQVFPGLFTTAQTLLDEQIIKVDVSAVPAFDIDAFRTEMSTALNFPTVTGLPVADSAIPAGLVLYDSDATIVYIGLNTLQSVAGGKAGYITDIPAIAGYALAVPTSLVVTLDFDGSFTTATHGAANSIAAIMNALNDPTGIATTNLNVEIITENGAGDELVLYDPSSFALAASGSFIDVPSPGVEFDLTLVDTFHIEYSIYGDDAVDDRVHMTGTLKLSAHDVAQVSDVVNEFISSEDLTAPASIEFQTVISPGAVKLQYKHDFPMSLTFKTITRYWRSF